MLYHRYKWRPSDFREHATTYKKKLNIPVQKSKLNIKTNITSYTVKKTFCELELSKTNFVKHYAR